MPDAVFPVLFVRMNDGFGVRVGREFVPFLFQLFPKFRVVVYFPIEDDPDTPILVGNRLVSCLEVNDLEAPHSETDIAVQKEAFIVRAPVREGIGHSPDIVQRYSLAPVIINNPCYSTHRFIPPPSGRPVRSSLRTIENYNGSRRAAGLEPPLFGRSTGPREQK